MTPGINAAKHAGITYQVHEYVHEESSESYGLEAASKLAVSADRVFKTLIVSLDSGALAVAIVPVACMLCMKAMAKAAGVKKAAMADKEDVQRSSGYVLGGVSPLGQKKRLKTVIDSSVEEHTTVFVSAGRRGLEIELSPADLIALTHASLAGIAVSGL